MKTSYLIALAFTILLCSCTPDPIIKYKYIEKAVPVNAVPAPPEVEKPVYETTRLTEEDRKDIGKVAKAVAIESKQKDGYIKILELIINRYKELSESAGVHVEPLELPTEKDTP